jgi:hypothetical protein
MISNAALMTFQVASELHLGPVQRQFFGFDAVVAALSLVTKEAIDSSNW